MDLPSLDVFVGLVQDHRTWGYLALFLAMLFEGETVLILAGMLAALGALDAGDVLWVAFVGIVLGNMIWYTFGSRLKDALFAQKTIRWAEKAITFFLPRFREKPFNSIFFSKFIYGANRATVIMSGALRVPFQLFFKAELLASIIWVGIYFEVGYLLGDTAVKMTHRLSRLALIALLFVIGFILLQKFLTDYFERRAHQKNEKNNNA
ncbi:MAG: DedA family protein [Minisyncoccia bacterium]